MKNRKMIIGIIIGIIFLLMVGFSYAYFTGILTIDEGPNNIVTETGTLTLTYVDGPQILEENIKPGWEITKTVSVENTGSLTAFYSINWKSINNTVERNELVMSSTCTGVDCKTMEEEVVGNAAGPFLSGIRIDPEAIHTYTLKFKLKEMSSAQNYNQGKIFNGVLNIAQSIETFTLRGTLLNSSDIPIPNVQIVLRSEPQTNTTTTSLNGRFIFENVEVGNHTIEAINGSSQEILDDEISINSGDTFDIKGTTISKEISKKEIDIEIKLGGSNNISNIIKTPSLIEKMNLSLAQSDSSIDFGIISSSGNGQGLYYTSDLTKTEDYDDDGIGERVYYYRGVVENNYVLFAGFCWRIVRTNEDGSIKLRYGGEPTGTSGNYTCPQTGTDIYVGEGNVAFNQTYGDNTYLGYMIGLENQCANTTTCVGTVQSTTENAQANTYDSNIKSIIDVWYRNNIANKGKNITSKIKNTIYCNDRSVGNPGTIKIGSQYYTFTSNAFGRNNIIYGAGRRLATGGNTGTSETSTNASPQYKCPNIARDGFTLSVANGGESGYGNNKLTYPIALLTADEVSFAGGVLYTDNPSYYLKTSSVYFTMSPYLWIPDDACDFDVRTNGDLSGNDVRRNLRAVPAISLISESNVLAGNGNYNSPYEIE